MEGKTLSVVALFLVVSAVAVSGVKSLSADEERRLILDHDTSVIDERIRELPGGVLLPPEVEQPPVPTMDPPLPGSKGKVISFDRYTKASREGINAGPRDKVKSMIRRLQAYGHTPSSSHSSYRHHLSSSSSTKKSLTQSPSSSNLEVALKRIEILAHRAGFTLSAVPRRTQLHIISKLADKLPTSLRSIVKNSIKSDVRKVYEFLPEPSRDPLVEDNPDVSSATFSQEFKDDSSFPSLFSDEELFIPKKKHAKVPSHDKVSLAVDSYVPENVKYQSSDDISSSLHQLAPPSDRQHSDDVIGSYGDRRNVQQSQNQNYDILGSYSEKVEEKLPTPEALTTTKKIQINREKNKPIRVSIISKDSLEDVPLPRSTTPTTTTTTSTTTTTTEAPTPRDTITKYIRVQDLTQNKTNLLFELEAQQQSASEQEDNYYQDLSSGEIEAMVKELEKYEDGSSSMDHLFFNDNPHELEFPDHPEHVETTATTTGVGKEEEELLRKLEGEIREKKRKLIGGKRPSGPYPVIPLRRPYPLPYHPHPAIRRPPPPRGPPKPQMVQQPTHLNEIVTSKQDLSCTHMFSPDVCLAVEDYPIEAITEAIKSFPMHISALLPKEDDSSTPSGSEGGEVKPTLEKEGGFLCPSKVAYGRIKKAKSSVSGAWKWVINFGDEYKQTLRVEKCLTPGSRCSYVQPHFRTACTQVYNYHRLLAWDEVKGLHWDVFKIPTVCTCHVQGYYYSPYGHPHPQSPAPHPLVAQRRRVMASPPPAPPRPRAFPSRHQLPRGPMQGPYQPARPHPQAVTAATVNVKEEESLQELLKQYNSLRDKIYARNTKEKSSASPTSSALSKRSSRMLNLIENVLLRRKRKNGNENSKLKKLLKKMQKDGKGKKDRKEVMKEAKSRLGKMLEAKKKKKVSTSRRGRNMKLSKKEMLKKLLKQVRKKKILKKKKIVASKKSGEKVNFDYHPIMDFIK